MGSHQDTELRSAKQENFEERGVFQATEEEWDLGTVLTASQGIHSPCQVLEEGTHVFLLKERGHHYFKMVVAVLLPTFLYSFPKGTSTQQGHKRPGSIPTSVLKRN